MHRPTGLYAILFSDRNIMQLASIDCSVFFFFESFVVLLFIVIFVFIVDGEGRGIFQIHHIDLRVFADKEDLLLLVQA